jgi:hypothetical protein
MCTWFESRFHLFVEMLNERPSAGEPEQDWGKSERSSEFNGDSTRVRNSSGVHARLLSILCAGWSQRTQVKTAVTWFCYVTPGESAVVRSESRRSAHESHEHGAPQRLHHSTRRIQFTSASQKQPSASISNEGPRLSRRSRRLFVLLLSYGRAPRCRATVHKERYRQGKEYDYAHLLLHDDTPIWFGDTDYTCDSLIAVSCYRDVRLGTIAQRSESVVNPFPGQTSVKKAAQAHYVSLDRQMS